jgi:predicted ATP-dependent endonuclease of OLD family
MIERVLIKNFQVHEKLDMQFGPVTTIIGQTDSGKSAIIRALLLVCTNEPSGDEYIRKDSNGTTVAIRIDGHVIKRIKTKSKNEYILDGETLQAFRSSVPEPVQAILQMGEVNYQQQHDAPFWFSCTAGQVSKHLNAIVNLDLIDQTFSKIQNHITAHKTLLKNTDKKLEEATDKKCTLFQYTKANKSLSEIEGLEKDITQKRLQCGRLRELLKQGQTHKNREINSTNALQAAKTVCETEGVYKSCKNKRFSLYKAINAYRKLQKTSGIPTQDLQDKLSLFKTYKTIHNRKVVLAGHIEKLRGFENRIGDMETDLQSAVDKRQKMFKEGCPLCHRPIQS